MPPDITGLFNLAHTTASQKVKFPSSKTAIPFLLVSLCTTAALLAFPLKTEAAATISKPPNNLGLVGYWSFNDGTGTQATDFSGNGNTGTFADGASWTSGKRGKAVGLDGLDDSVIFGDIAVADFGTSAFSIAFWIKHIGEGDVVMNKREVCSFDSWWEIGIDGEIGIAMDTNSGDLFSLDSINTSLSDNTWHHVVFTRSGTTIQVYVDGAFDDSDTAPTNYNFSNAGSFDINDHPCIGVDGRTGMVGAVDEVRIYNRALGPTEIAKLYGSGAVKVGASSVALQQGSTLANGLVGHWTFDGPDVTTTVTDRSGQGNNGYFIGGATSSAKVIGKLGQALNFDGSVLT